MKKPCLVCCLAAWVFPLCLTAQDSPSTDIDIQARRESVITLEKHLEMRQKRLDEVAAEIRERGGKTDQQIGVIVKMLTDIKDSQDSKRRVSMVKAEAIAGLKRMIETYQTERRTIAERLRTGDVPSAEALAKDMKLIDGLVDKRAADIIALVKSMPGGDDVAKYESDDGSYHYGHWEEDSRISEEWRQNRRDNVQTDKQRREVRDALEKAIASLESRKSALTAQLGTGGAGAAEMELQKQELAHLETLLAQRKIQLMEVTAPSAGAAESVSGHEADDMKDLFEDARRDVAAEFSRTLRLYHSAVAERDRIEKIRLNLQARRKWLSENDPEAKKSE